MGICLAIGLIGAGATFLKLSETAKGRTAEQIENDKVKRFVWIILLIVGALALDVLVGAAAAGVGGAILNGKLSATAELGYALVGYGAGSALLAGILIGVAIPTIFKSARLIDSVTRYSGS